MKILNNKKGDVSTTILVIGVFVVCGLAIGSFFYSNLLFENSFGDIGTMQKANVGIERNTLMNYHDEVLKKEFEFSWDFDFVKDVIVFSIDYSQTG